MAEMLLTNSEQVADDAQATPGAQVWLPGERGLRMLFF